MLKEKYDLSKSEKYKNLFDMMCSFKPGKNDTGENVFSKIEQIETEFEILKISDNIVFFGYIYYEENICK